jgi:hypothetical protein
MNPKTKRLIQSALEAHVDAILPATLATVTEDEMIDYFRKLGILEPTQKIDSEPVVGGYGGSVRQESGEFDVSMLGKELKESPKTEFQRFARRRIIAAIGDRRLHREIEQSPRRAPSPGRNERPWH